MCAGPSSWKHRKPLLRGAQPRPAQDAAPSTTPLIKAPAAVPRPPQTYSAGPPASRSGRRSAGLPGGLAPLSGHRPPWTAAGPLGRTRLPRSAPPSNRQPRSPQAALALRRLRSEPQAGATARRRTFPPGPRWRLCEDLRQERPGAPSQGFTPSARRADGRVADRTRPGASGAAPGERACFQASQGAVGSAGGG